MSRCVNQSEFIWAICIKNGVVSMLSVCFKLRNHGVAQPQTFQVPQYVLMIFMRRVIELIEKLIVVKVHIGDSRLVFPRLGVRGTISVAPNRELLELHYILSQRACFIRKDIVHHSQFLIQI